MIINKNNITSIVDKHTNLLYIYLGTVKSILFINKFIYKLCYINKTYLNFKIFYDQFVNQFNKILRKTIKCLYSICSVNIIINRIHYHSILLENKLIVKIGNLNNVIIYIPNIDKVNIHISKKNDLISLSCKDEHYLTDLSSLIKNIKKIDRCTGVGMHYDNEKILFKRKIVNDSNK